MPGSDEFIEQSINKESELKKLINEVLIEKERVILMCAFDMEEIDCDECPVKNNNDECTNNFQKVGRDLLRKLGIIS